jgi:uncharacterized protein (TIGR04141 family)
MVEVGVESRFVMFSRTGCIYHVEDYHGSASLSHLFALGTVSGRPLLEQEFRQEFVNKHPNLQGAPIQPVAIDPGHMEVVYTIMCEQNRAIPQDLPFSARFAWVSRRGNREEWDTQTFPLRKCSSLTMLHFPH